MPKLEAGSYLYFRKFAEGFRWWRVVQSSNEHGHHAAACCVERMVHSVGHVEKLLHDEKANTWEIQKQIGEPFTEFEYLLLQTTRNLQ